MVTPYIHSLKNFYIFYNALFVGQYVVNLIFTSPFGLLHIHFLLFLFLKQLFEIGKFSDAAN